MYGLSESEDSPHPSTYIVGTIGEPETFDPAFLYDTASSCWVWRFYDPLARLKRDSRDEFVGQLADEWEISDDGLTYTFHTRDGVTFHEGGGLDAHDAAYAIWRGLLRDRAAGPQWMFWDAIFGFETVEDCAIHKANEALELQSGGGAQRHDKIHGFESALGHARDAVERWWHYSAPLGTAC